MKRPNSPRNDRQGAEGQGRRKVEAAGQAVSAQAANQLHGITKEMILAQLWEALYLRSR